MNAIQRRLAQEAEEIGQYHDRIPVYPCGNCGCDKLHHNEDGSCGAFTLRKDNPLDVPVSIPCECPGWKEPSNDGDGMAQR